MSITVNFHGIEKCEASELPNVENDVLKIHAKDGSLLNLYMPMAMAQAMADAFNRAKAHESGHLTGNAAIGGEV